MNHHELATVADELHQAWLHNEPLRPDLERFRLLYRGAGENAPDFDGMPEPFVGDIRNARFANVAINPGGAVPRFQYRDGLWPELIRREHGGSYTEWAATSPYTSEWWTATEGRNRNVVARIDFATGWTGQQVQPSEVLFMETWWWHSKGWDGGRYARDLGLERDLLWEPIHSLELDWVFGFGRGFVDAMHHNPEIEIVHRLGKGSVPSKSTTMHWTIGAHANGTNIAGMVAANNRVPPIDEAGALRQILEPLAA